MKLYIVNPMYTSLFLVIVLSAYVSSLSLYITGGKTYLNNEYEIIYGGSRKVITKIGGSDFAGVKRIRRLTPKEILELKERRSKPTVIEKKQEEEKHSERKLSERRGIKRPRRNTKKAQRKAGTSQYDMELIQSNTGQQIRRTLSNKQKKTLGRFSRRKNFYT